MRRFLTAIILVSIVAAAGWTLYRWQLPTGNTTDPWSAVPRQAALILEVPDAWSTWDRFTHTTQLWAALERVPEAAAAGRIMTNTMARMENDAALRNALDGTSLLVALLRGGGGKVGTVFIGAPVGQDPGPLAAFGELIGADAAAVEALARGGVVQVRPDTALNAFSMCIRKGLWLMASSTEVMDEVLLQLASEDPMTNDTLFAQAMSTLGAGTDAHILLHTARTERLLNTWWLPASLERLELPAGWAALDLRARPDALLMSGLLVPEAEHPLLTAMEAQGVGRNTLTRVLPARVSALDVQHIANAAQWPDARMAGKSDASSFEALFSWVSGSMGLASAPGINEQPVQRWALFATEDPDAAVAALATLCADGCDTLGYRDTRLTRLPIGGAHEQLLGAAFDFLERPWWIVLGDVVLFSNDQNALFASIDVWNDGGSLAEDTRTSSWFERISEEAGRLLWCDVARSGPILRSGLKTEVQSTTANHDSLWQEFGGLSMQLSPGQRGYHHLVIGLEHAHLETQDAGVLWSTPIGAAIARKPSIVRNHLNNTREVLVEDVQHRIHLLGSNGKVLWKRDLDGPIMGAVTQVDRFRNGKLQLLFNTESRIYLIDRNGEDVGGFPVVLKDKASAPLSVFDYDQQKDYRLLLPTQDGRVLNFGLDGSPVKGWEIPNYSVAALNPVEHLRIKNKDYLLVVDGTGKVNLLDRRGEARATSDLDLGPKSIVQKVIPGMELGTTSMVWTDALGALYSGTIAGRSNALAPLKDGKTWLVDLGNDGSSEIVRITADSLIVMSDGRVDFTRAFGTPLLQELHLCELGRDRVALCVVRSGTGQVTLIDGMGRELAGLPVPGATPCSIADLELDGNLELITATADGTVSAHRVPGLSGGSP